MASVKSGKKFRLVSLVAVAAIALTTFGASASAATSAIQTESSIITTTGGDASYIPEPLQEPVDGPALWQKYAESQKKSAKNAVTVSTASAAVLSAAQLVQLKAFVGSDEFLDGIHKLSREDLRILKTLLSTK